MKGKSKCTDCSTKDKDKERKKFTPDNLNDDEKEQLRQDDNKRKKEKILTLIVMKRNSYENMKEK